MQTPTEAVLLRIFVTEDSRHGLRPLYEAIVEQAFELGMAGATVLPGPTGFGHGGRVRSELNVDAGPHLPMVVEIVDSEEMIDRFLPVVDSLMDSGLVTVERVKALRYPAACPTGR